ncbi:MAG: hypothetical protein M1608_04555 [Candidatus Omnitrophica bacterium]|nr:hypothetical protein [Candidatus Omnitrophota bacterium]
MKTSKRKSILVTVLAVFTVLVIAWLTIYILSGPADAVALNQPILEGLRKEWLIDGSPENPPINKYVAHWTDPERFFIWTNIYTINGRMFHSLFAMSDPKFAGKGILVVSRNGALIWVDKANSPRLLKTER